MRSEIRARAAVAAIAVGLLAMTTLAAQAPPTTEYQIKAAYLYNFGRFVQWPTNTSREGPFAICVLGQDPFGHILDTTLTGVSIDGKPVVARRIGKVQDAEDCRIVFISGSEASQLKETLLALERKNALTVSDIPQFAQHGGAIQFVVAGNKVRFEINLTNAQNAGLVLSSDLLKVAIAVRKTPGAGD